MRAPLDKWKPFHPVPPKNKGIQWKNVEPEIATLITRPNGSIDGSMYQLLQIYFSIDDLYNMLEAVNVHKSWETARMRDQNDARSSNN